MSSTYLVHTRGHWEALDDRTILNLLHKSQSFQTIPQISFQVERALKMLGEMREKEILPDLQSALVQLGAGNPIGNDWKTTNV